MISAFCHADQTNCRKRTFLILSFCMPPCLNQGFLLQQETLLHPMAENIKFELNELVSLLDYSTLKVSSVKKSG